ncbi:glycine betaine ABC transporter substrate-binding protein [Agrococcus carbonis]|uniref:Glycine betaine/proline transport system substrate-binding protein n=1 Tax=Agrococcus carbonis TaxID=684552 RepID=A0A1H1RXM7_9MICO|nr:glycine betaine ABC transporter substrate-binding protein [Agrococcus carbonis]SDS40445.1 glycine betaine/proline transport system substrate-binding protein [Agrococcus carbonis]
MQKRFLRGAALVGAAAIALTGCASTDAADEAPEGATGSDQTDLTVGVFNGWPEGEAVSYLWEAVLEEQGYDVTLEYADAGPVWAAVGSGSYDVNFDAWLPMTHAGYLEEYGDSIEDLGSWNDDAVLTFAVNEDAPIQSIAELAENADAFGNRIVGIEPGAGLTQATQNEVIPTYGLEGMEFQTSSTPAMLAELSGAIESGENVVVTLWRPHWAYDEFAIRDLEDPEGSLGEAEGIHTIARTGFAEDFPQLTEWFSAFEMDSELLFSLENAMFNSDADPSDYPEIVEAWIDENREWVDTLTAPAAE